jgi:hypothetical protein
MLSARFSDVGERLLRAGVAPRHVRRAVREMTDHFDDIVIELSKSGWSHEDAEVEAVARLNPDALLAAAIARPELHSWARRWPIASCTVFPLAVYMAFVVGSIALVVGGVTVFDHTLGMKLASSRELQQFATFSLSGITWAIPVFAAGTFSSLMLARRMSVAWTVVGATLVSLVGATMNAGLVLPPNDAPAMQAGFGFGTDVLAEPLLRAALTLVLVLPIYFWRRAVSLGRAPMMPTSRIVAIATVIGLHSAVIALLLSARGARIEPYTDDTALTLIVIPPLAPPREVLPDRTASSPPPPRIYEAPSSATPLDTKPAPEQRTPIDWSHEAELAVARGVDTIELERRRARGFTPDVQNREPEITAPSAPEFGWSSTAQRVEALPEGGVLIRLSERCVIVVTTMMFPACGIGEIPVNGDLFEHMDDPPVLGDWKED